MISDCELNEFLNHHGIESGIYSEFVRRYIPGDCKFVQCSSDGFDYMVSHFLDKSEKMGYGLIVTNETLETEKTGKLAIGLIEGDDVICLDPQTGRISLWLIQSGNGECINVAETFQDFMKTCCENIKMPLSQ